MVLGTSSMPINWKCYQWSSTTVQVLRIKELWKKNLKVIFPVLSAFNMKRVFQLNILNMLLWKFILIEQSKYLKNKGLAVITIWSSKVFLNHLNPTSAQRIYSYSTFKERLIIDIHTHCVINKTTWLISETDQYIEGFVLKTHCIRRKVSCPLILKDISYSYNKL